MDFPNEWGEGWKEEGPRSKSERWQSSKKELNVLLIVP